MSPAPEDIRKYAEAAVKVGLNLQPGQRLVLLTSIETAELARLITQVAYQMGTPLVDVHWSDEKLHLIRHQHAPRDSFEEFPLWKAKALTEAAKRGDAIISIQGGDPDLLSEQDPELISLEQRTAEKHFEQFQKYIYKDRINWLIITAPTKAWARKVLPNHNLEDQVTELWKIILTAARVLHDDPVTHWREHIKNLSKRANYLTKKQYRYLHYHAPGTNLKVGLPQSHIWGAAETTSKSGIAFIPNMPTEEVFTLPHKDETEGVVTSSKQLHVSGQLVENFTLTFKKGRVTKIKAQKGQKILENLIETDDGASRLGEVALVPHSSPISQLGITFYNTLFDENAASHIALGNAVHACLKDGTKISDEEFTKRGGNISKIHTDFMVGSDKLEIDGITKENETERIMSHGEWAFEA